MRPGFAVAPIVLGSPTKSSTLERKETLVNKRIGTLGTVLATAAIVSGLLVALGSRGDADANAATTATQDVLHRQDPVNQDQHGASDAHRPVSPRAVAFHDAMRKLWEDHITWTRLFIVSAAADLPDTGVTAERLLQNQTDIGNAIKPFYGDAAGTQLTALLRDHIIIAGDILAAAKSGDAPTTEANSARWYANGEEIAAFLSAANPDAWPAPEMNAMMTEHLDLTLEEAVARLQGNYAADIAAYEKIHASILEMADMLSAGIITQFPREFR
jgi:hypothetical protein